MKNIFRHNKSNKNSSSKSKYSLDKDFVAKVCCVLFALVLWFVVVSQSTDLEQEMTFYAVPVSISNANILQDDFGLSIVSEVDYITNVTVRGSRAKLTKFSSEDISAVLDVQNITQAGEHDVPIKVTPPPSSGFNVVGQSLESVKVTVDTLSSITLDVDVNILNAKYDADKYTLGEPSVSPSKVEITGPQKLLDSISSACVNLELGNVNSTIGFNRPIVLLDSKGDEISSTYLSLSHVYADGQIPLKTIEEASKIVEKTIVLDTSFKFGYYNKENCMVKIYPSTVKVKGSDYILSKIDSLEFFEIDETIYTTNTVFDTELVLPDGISLAESVGKITVSISISDDLSNEEISLEEVSFSEPQGAYTASVADNQTLIFRGDRETLGKLKNNPVAVSVSVDISKITEAGTYKLPCKVTIESDYSDVWCDTQYILVQVK